VPSEVTSQRLGLGSMKIGVSWLVWVRPKANTERSSAHEAALQSRKRVFREPLLLFVEWAGSPANRDGTWCAVSAIGKCSAGETVSAQFIWDHPRCNDAPN
jgi:hypothetical protein